MVLLVAAIPLATTAINAGASPGWAITSTANPPVPNGSMAAVSCGSSTACIAVGSYASSSGSSAPFAESRAGTTWTLQNVPVPAGAVASFFNAVSCVSATSCTAVGYLTNSVGTHLPIAEHWDGTSWSVQPINGEPGASVTELWGISCVSSGACIAVGSYAASSGRLTFAEAWDGNSWSVQSTPDPPQSTAHLRGVACSSSTRCIAVGSSTSSYTGRTSTLAEHWDGTTWRIQSMPNLGGVAELSSVACFTAIFWGTSCIAVGYFNSGSFTGGLPLTLAELWWGGRWRLLAAANPAGTIGAFLDGVSCSGLGVCAAVGYYEPGSGSAPILPLSETWDSRAGSSRWFIGTTPSPSGTLNALFEGIACPQPASCVAVGYYAQTGAGPAGARANTLAEGSSGGTWSIEPSPNPPGSMGAGLNGISCPAANACEAVGFYADPSGNLATLAESWDGTQWATQASPNPTSPSSATTAVSCPAATTCMAVGNYYNGSASQVFSESWNGTSWSIQSTPGPSGAVDAHLTSISCPSATDCTAAGYYSTTGSNELPLAELWNGSAWSIQSMPIPSGSLTAVLEAVSCSSSGACVAVGYYSASSSGGTLAESWDGGAWSILPTAKPNGFSGSFTAVSCLSATSCESVGGFNPGTGYPTPFAASWNGSTWTIQSMPTPGGSLLSGATALSCTSSSNCTAVGYYEASSSFEYFTLAESWNGASWSVAATPNPPGPAGSRLFGVACPTSCMAVGRGNGETLAMSDG